MGLLQSLIPGRRVCIAHAFVPCISEKKRMCVCKYMSCLMNFAIKKIACGIGPGVTEIMWDMSCPKRNSMWDRGREVCLMMLEIRQN